MSNYVNYNHLSESLMHLKKVDLVSMLIQIAQNDTNLVINLLKQYDVSHPHDPQVDHHALEVISTGITTGFFNEDDFYSGIHDLQSITDSIINHSKPTDNIVDIMFLGIISEALSDPDYCSINSVNRSIMLNATTSVKTTIEQVMHTLLHTNLTNRYQAQQAVLYYLTEFSKTFEPQTLIHSVKPLMPLFSTKNSPELERTFANAITTNNSNGRTYSENEIITFKNQFHATLLIALGKLDDANHFTEKHFNDPELQRIRLSLIQSQELDTDLERLAPKATINEWYVALLNLYYRKHRPSTLILILEQRLFNKEGTQQDFLKLRQALTDTNHWMACQKNIFLRVAKECNPYTAGIILSTERAFPELLYLVENRTTNSLLTTYGTIVFQQNPAKITQLLDSALNKLITQRGNRERYSEITKLLQVYVNVGKIETASQWRDNLLIEYPHRTALREELSHLKLQTH